MIVVIICTSPLVTIDNDKYKYIIYRVEFNKGLTGTTTFANAVPDIYHMFVDNSLFANIKNIIKHTMRAYIEVLYFVLVFPEEIFIIILSVSTNTSNQCILTRISNSESLSAQERRQLVSPKSRD